MMQLSLCCAREARSRLCYDCINIFVNGTQHTANRQIPLAFSHVTSFAFSHVPDNCFCDRTPQASGEHGLVRRHINMAHTKAKGLPASMGKSFRRMAEVACQTAGSLGEGAGARKNAGHVLGKKACKYSTCPLGYAVVPGGRGHSIPAGG